MAHVAGDAILGKKKSKIKPEAKVLIQNKKYRKFEFHKNIPWNTC